MDNVKIIGSRRAYEFAPDEIRLSSLTLPAQLTAIQQAFQFQSVSVATPPATFGPVPETLPPGLVFSLGQVETPGGNEVLIRLLHLESRRVVVDVAGPSSAIDAVYQTFRTLLADAQSADGSPVLGKPTGIRDQSTLSAHLAFAPDDLLPPRLRTVFQAAGSGEQAQPRLLAPTMLVETVPANQEYLGVHLDNPDVFQFSLRAGVAPDAQVYFSVAPLASDGHIRFLQDFEAAMTSIPSRESG